ncbi:MAG: hypothetical protein QOE00_3034 [Ilumatobacteraceae bacterium]
MTEHPGAGALRVEIDHEHLVTSESSRGGQAKGHRGLADATLLVQQRRDTPTGSSCHNKAHVTPATSGDAARWGRDPVE